MEPINFVFSGTWYNEYHSEVTNCPSSYYQDKQTSEMISHLKYDASVWTLTQTTKTPPQDLSGAIRVLWHINKDKLPKFLNFIYLFLMSRMLK